MELAFSIAFMVFGLVYLHLGSRDSERVDDKRYRRELNEAREFGYRDSSLESRAKKLKK